VRGKKQETKSAPPVSEHPTYQRARLRNRGGSQQQQQATRAGAATRTHKAAPAAEQPRHNRQQPQQRSQRDEPPHRSSAAAPADDHGGDQQQQRRRRSRRRRGGGGGSGGDDSVRGDRARDAQGSADGSAEAADTALIATPESLAQFLPRLASSTRVALDTEADSLHAYREKLCLIQVGLPDGAQELIDPLADFSLTPLYEALRGKEIILHGADYDLRLLRRAGGFTADAVFDTMLAARLCGRREFSYAALVKSEFGIELIKGSQKANWARRPLTAAMASYARNDTRYLLGLAERLEARLRELGRWDWFQQSCNRALEIAATDKERDSEDAWRIQGSGVFRGRAAAILRELWRWRDEEASVADRPAFHVLRNEELLTAARQIDETGEAPTFKHLHGSRLRRYHESIEHALALPEAEWPVFVRPRGNGRMTAEMTKRVEELRATRDRAAGELDLEPSFIAARTALEAIAVRPEAAAEWLLPWQRTLIGA